MPIPAYSGTFGKPQLLHLLRRTLFGVSKADLTTFSGQTLSQVVETLIADLPAPTPPLVDYAEVNATGTTTTAPIRTWNYTAIPIGQTWVNDNTTDNRIYNSNRQSSLRRWWLGLMLNQDRNIREKMVLFWHNHIPTEIGNSVTEAVYIYRYNALLRQYAVGNFKDLIRQMTIEPAMLLYLNGRNNRNTGPDENYARELQELFCVGKDLSPHYTEADVQAAAKVLTGWQLTTNKPDPANASNYINDFSSMFTLSRHDITNKVFSSFYNGTTITGQNNANGGMTELNALLDMIFAHPEVARFIVRKLYRFFVYYKIDATVEANVIVPLADTFRTNNYDIKPVLRELLNSQHFFDTANSTACLIKNPADYCIGMARAFGLNTAGASIQTTYANQGAFDNEMNNQQMRLGNPPNVAGWGAYYQIPNFHKLWINAETLRRRKEFNDRLIFNGLNGQRINVLAFTQSMTTPSDPNLLIDEVVELLHISAMDAAIKAQLKSILLSGQAADFYWTNAWTDYISAPTNTTFLNIVQGRLRTFYQALTNMAEFHIG
jgi:uncharacterized protein (DUF1800 family)